MELPVLPQPPARLYFVAFNGARFAVIERDPWEARHAVFEALLYSRYEA